MPALRSLLHYPVETKNYYPERMRCELREHVRRSPGRVQRVDISPASSHRIVLASGGRPPQTPPLLGGPIPPDPPWGDRPPGTRACWGLIPQTPLAPLVRPCRGPWGCP